MERPDLTGIPADVIAYIESLESRLENTTPARSRNTPPPEPSEPPTSINLISISTLGLIKRTPRHLYGRQRRGGMGIFDIELPEGDQPRHLLLADAEADVIVITNFARVFRLPVANLPEADIRAKGVPLSDFLALHGKEEVTVVLGGDGQKVLLMSANGKVISRNKLYLRNGAVLYDTNKQGEPAFGCWSSGADDVFIATEQGLAIRFSETQVSKSGSLGIRLEEGDRLVGLTAVPRDGGVFLLSHDGKGTIRLMEGFRANKSPGAGGKVAMKTDKLTAVQAVREGDDIFIISQLSKLIRFQAAEIPAKTGVVQGVNCMALRADETATAVVAQL